MKLSELMQQYELETGESTKYTVTLLMYEESRQWTNKFVRWLASRPTCGVEQRKFLDEIREKFRYDNYHTGGIYSEGQTAFQEKTYLLQDDFKSNLKELVNE